ncbi:MAG TPA: hypothetical protein EYH34_14785 [Planctomycetes bacterium]|nr:hypothetical protein [Planctomycetota bacterium]
MGKPSCGGAAAQGSARDGRLCGTTGRGVVSMLSGVSIICFAGSYILTLALELTRILFRSGIRGALMLICAGAGLFAHTVFLVNRAVAEPGAPLSSKQDWYLVAAWVLVVMYLYLVSYHPRTAFGVFILPLVLGLVAIGAFWADTEPFPREPAARIWSMIHGMSLLMATVAVLVGFVAGLMYLGQARRLKRKLPPRPGLRLPSLEWLQRANSRAIVTAVLFLAIGILSGVVLNLIHSGAAGGTVPLTDPLVLSTVLMFAWLVACVIILAFYKPAREGHRVAYLTVASFLFLVIALAVGLSTETHHTPSRLKPSSEAAGRRRGVPWVGWRPEGYPGNRVERWGPRMTATGGFCSPAGEGRV